MSEHVDPLSYPLLHVYGTLGYSSALCSRTGHKISMADFYAHRIMQRFRPSENIVELPHSGGRLFQQYVVDAYAKVESMRLSWAVANQDRLRCESLRGIIDYLAGAHEISETDV